MVDLASYRQRRIELENSNPIYRQICLKCRQPEFGCYCSLIQSFDPKIKFAILIHPIEEKRRIATGRMSYLCLQNSMLIKGENFTNCKQVNFLIEDQNLQKLILYPGRNAWNLSERTFEETANFFDSNKKLLIFVIDGTWNTARKTMHLSQNLQKIPQICFTPTRPSNFRVRKQPNQNCFSTIEAIHQSIELCGPHYGFESKSRQHDHLLTVFDSMVERQLPFTDINKSNPRRPRGKA